MAIIVSGKIGYDSTNLYSYGSSATPAAGIANVPIVLQDTTSGAGAVALTASDGSYTFFNVPAV